MCCWFNLKALFTAFVDLLGGGVGNTDLSSANELAEAWSSLQDDWASVVPKDKEGISVTHTRSGQPSPLP